MDCPDDICSFLPLSYNYLFIFAIPPKAGIAEAPAEIPHPKSEIGYLLP